MTTALAAVAVGLILSAIPLLCFSKHRNYQLVTQDPLGSMTGGDHTRYARRKPIIVFKFNRNIHQVQNSPNVPVVCVQLLPHYIMGCFGGAYFPANPVLGFWNPKVFVALPFTFFGVVLIYCISCNANAVNYASGSVKVSVVDFGAKSHVCCSLATALSPTSACARVLPPCDCLDRARCTFRMDGQRRLRC